MENKKNDDNILSPVDTIPEEKDEFDIATPQVSQLVNHLRRKTVMFQDTRSASVSRSQMLVAEE